MQDAAGKLDTPLRRQLLGLEAGVDRGAELQRLEEGAQAEAAGAEGGGEKKQKKEILKE